MRTGVSNNLEGGVVRTVTVLSVDPILTDDTDLKQIFSRADWSTSPDLKWALASSPTAESALTTIGQEPIPILLCGCDRQPNTWKEMLAAFSGLSQPPMLILTSRTADDRLWAEALNLGAYDVLSKPFDRNEVTRVLSLAWMHWKERARLSAGATRHGAQASMAGMS